MPEIILRREIPYPLGLNDGFAKECCMRIMKAILDENRVPEFQTVNPLEWELSVSLVDDDEIKGINKRFRNIDEATDVLSFPQYEPDEVRDFITSSITDQLLVLGDIVISLEWLKRESADDPDVSRRLFAWMVVHSILHLLGYDHDIEEEEQHMKSIETQILLLLEDLISEVNL